MGKLLKVNAKLPETHLLEKAARVIKSGGVIAYPTETVYGLGCSAFNSEAVDRIYQLKARDKRKALILIAADIIQVNDLVKEITPDAMKLIENFWPGPITIIFEGSDQIREFAFGKSKTIAVRIPDSAIALALVQISGVPIISTSANLSGQPPATDAQQVIDCFGNDVDMIIDGGRSPSDVPSTVVDTIKSPARIIRAGAISTLEINTVLKTA